MEISSPIIPVSFKWSRFSLLFQVVLYAVEVVVGVEPEGDGMKFFIGQLHAVMVLFKVIGGLGSVTSQVKRYLHLMHEYGRWAMLDVMVVAILIVTVKLGALASVEVHVGFYVFAAAVLLIMFITHRVIRLSDMFEQG